MSQPAKTVRISRDPAVQDIVGVAQAAEIIGVEPTRIARYVKAGWMPPHIKVVGKTKIWVTADIEAVAVEIRERVGKRWRSNR